MMLGYVLRKLAGGAVLFLIVTALSYGLLFARSETIARQILGHTASEEVVAERTARLGLDQPVYEQYLSWLTGAMRGDLGRSFYGGEEVSSIILSRLPATLSIVSLTLILLILFSVIIGVTAAVKRGWIDATLQSVAILGVAVPSFVLAIGLVLALAVAVPLFPATGYVEFGRSPTGWLRSLALPVVAVLISSVAAAAQQFRGAMVDVLEQDYIRTLRSRGVAERAIVLRHALRNAATPGLTTISLQTIGLMGGVVIIERIFALPGIGALLSTAALQRDVPVVMGTVMVTVVVVVLVNIALDLTVGWLNPKVRVR